MRGRRLGYVMLVLCALALSGGVTIARASEGNRDGWLDVVVWQVEADRSLQPLAGVTALLTGSRGEQVATATTDDAGEVHLTVPEGAYVLTLYRAGSDGAGRLSCGDTAWNHRGETLWGEYNAEQDTSLLIVRGRQLCRQYLFEATPTPAPALPVHPVHITFDDGYVSLCATIDLVIQLNIHATFFLTGQAILAHPDCVRRLVAAGNQLANHTYAHEDLTRLSQDQIIDTLQRTEDAAIAVAGVTTKPFCRPPYGAINAAVRQIAAQWGCQMILWDRDSRDWAGVPVSSITSTGLSLNCAGDTVLMHTQAYPRDQYALPAIISALRDRGCEPVVY